MNRERGWDEYCAVTSARPPRPLLLEVLARCDCAGLAIDFGCGGGVETLELLRRGWRVVAVDGETAAIARLVEVTPPAWRFRLDARVESFVGVELPAADLAWSALSLSFCARGDFEAVWSKLVGCVLSGGRVACDVFGVRHSWGGRPGMTFVDEDQALGLVSGLEVEVFREVEEVRRTAFEGMQHWHAFEMVARVP